MKKNLPQVILKLCAFVILANLPFLTMTQFIGIDSFLDSFQHPSSFYSIKNEKIQTTTPPGYYLILEKPSHQEFSIEEGDMILCYTTTNILQQTIVNDIRSEHGVPIYYTSSTETNDDPIYGYQIVGKIKGSFEENIWNTLCLYIWDLCINNLNVFTVFTPH